MDKWKTLQSNYIFKTPFGNVRKDTCELPNGHLIESYYVNEYDDWVNAIVVTKENQIVLVEQYRHAAQDFFLEVPAGKPEDGETYRDAVIREVREETGYISEKDPICLGEYYVNPATQTNKVITFFIQDAYLAYDQNLDATEFIDIHLVDIDEMEAKIYAGEINQLFTANAFFMSKSFFNGISKD
ncbi:NUDIX domain-containing protein [Ornithinibacillus sp. L9]|uniref:NUDIX domain-containing protein n=1 Tax=Ornithinibacillus caprae TaxID=2678566 RepID=A0A6N8FNE8_9BACI|nr:NUDIX domain-containing protein [Ornithinibacillus caprae]